jgi:hypothetical protein
MNKESLHLLNTSDMLNKISEVNRQQQHRKIEYDNADDWEIDLDSRYNEAISILNL